MRFSVVFSSVCPRFRMLRVTGAGTRRCVSFGAGCSLGAEVKRAVPLLQNETQNMNTTTDHGFLKSRRPILVQVRCRAAAR